MAVAFADARREPSRVIAQRQATLTALPVRPGSAPVALAVAGHLCFAAALACFVIMAWGFDWRAGMGALGVALLALAGMFLLLELRVASGRASQ